MSHTPHYESSQATTACKESRLQTLITCFEDKGSTLSEEASKVLQNFATNEIMYKEIRDDILNVFVVRKGK